MENKEINEVRNAMRKPSTIVTRGKEHAPNKTASGLGNKMVGIRTPLYGFRSYRDPKSKDLVDIEDAARENEELIEELSERAKSEIEQKKAIKSEKEKNALKEQIKAELEAGKE